MLLNGGQTGGPFKLNVFRITSRAVKIFSYRGSLAYLFHRGVRGLINVNLRFLDMKMFGKVALLYHLVSRVIHYIPYIGTINILTAVKNT